MANNNLLCIARSAIFVWPLWFSSAYAYSQNHDACSPPHRRPLLDAAGCGLRQRQTTRRSSSTSGIRATTRTPTPTLVYIHGGGWIFGSKEGALTSSCRFSKKAGVSSTSSIAWRVIRSLPAAVEDTRCALRWIFRNAKHIQFRYVEDRPHRPFRRRASFADNRDAAGRHAARQPLLRAMRNTAMCR